jgi:hypothetical protein
MLSGIFDLAKFAFFILRKYHFVSLLQFFYTRKLIKLMSAGLLKRSATSRRVTIQNKTTRPFNIFTSLTPAQQASQVGPAALVPRPSLPRAPPLTTCANADILGSLLSTACPSSFQRAARTLGATFYIQDRQC